MILTQFFNKKNLNRYKLLVEKIHKIADKNYINLEIQNCAEKLLEIKISKLKDKDKILHAMAIAKKAAQYVLGMSYYDVQLMGALSLVDGCISEMKTGEGKTLTCSAAVAANFVLGYKTHVATANEYLATRDLETLKPLYTILGITSGYCTSKMEKNQKRMAYDCEVLYSTAQELGFDFLRDNLVYNIKEKIQPLRFNNFKIIIDEADFILIDEARTPLIISGESPIKNKDEYQLIRNISKQLKKMEKAPNESLIEIEEMPEGDFWVDEKYKTVYLSESGYVRLEELSFKNEIIKTNEVSALYENHNSWIIHETLNALKAEYCYIKDKDYIVQNNEIIIIDTNTGRLSQGRSWSNGLHQAIETKELVKINPETITLGSISIQNFFRNYVKISGMSGTVMQSSQEFQEIYNTETISIPTNKEMIRKDYEDLIYLSMDSKYRGIIKDVEERHKRGQPILIGTTSVSESEIISNLLKKKEIKHHVLNAKNNFLEAQIIAQAGQPYAVTVSTSMAGRGTDIILGGNKEGLINIIDENRKNLTERLSFLTLMLEQLNLEENNNNVNDYENSLVVNDTNIDEQISLLYENEHIKFLLNRGIVFIKNHIENIDKLLINKKSIIEKSHKGWREKVINEGGLFVLGSSRNESRRIDNQLRGRAGRQGDVGESTFYLSIEDPWVNIFGKNPIFKHLAKTLPPNDAISSPLVTKAFAKAQMSIESLHFNYRKDTFQYDSVADEGRRQFMNLRNILLLNNDKVLEILKDSLIESLMPILHEEFVDLWMKN